MLGFADSNSISHFDKSGVGECEAVNGEKVITENIANINVVIIRAHPRGRRRPHVLLPSYNRTNSGSLNKF